VLKYKKYKPLNCFCHAKSEHSIAIVFPEPVGLSRRQFCPNLAPVTAYERLDLFNCDLKYDILILLPCMLTG